MNWRTIGRTALIGAMATTALASPAHTLALQQTLTCANEPYLARIVKPEAAATPAASPAPSPASSPSASPGTSPAASPAATPVPLAIAWLGGANDQSASAAVKRAAADLGARLIAPGHADAAALRDALRQGAQAVVVDSQATAALAPDLTNAANDGTAIVAVGADQAADGRRLDVVPPDGSAVATAAAQWLGDALGCGGSVLILSGKRDDAASNDAATAAANEFAAYGVHVADLVYGDDDPDLSFTRAAQTMIAYPGLTAILALTPNGIAAASSAVAKMDRAGKVEVVGIAAPGSKVSNSVPIVTWNPDDADVLAMHAAAALVAGKITGASGEQFDAGPLGTVTIGDEGVVAVPPIVVVPPGASGTPTP